MKGLAFPIVALFVAILAGTLAGPSQPNAKPFEIESVQVIPASTGPSFNPQVAAGCKCEGCLTDADVRKIVAEELGKRGYGQSRPLASNGSSGSPAVGTVISERVVSSVPVQQSQPQVIRRGIFGRQVIQSSPSNGTCRIVNGVMVCQ